MGDISINNLILLAIAIFNMLTAALALRTHLAVKQAQADIHTVEKATNSMKDALVQATAKASLAQGRQEGRDKAELEGAALAKNVANERAAAAKTSAP